MLNMLTIQSIKMVLRADHDTSNRWSQHGVAAVVEVRIRLHFPQPKRSDTGFRQGMSSSFFRVRDTTISEATVGARQSILDLQINGTDLKWSWLKNFRHTQIPCN
jgi:hypothetical protein